MTFVKIDNQSFIKDIHFRQGNIQELLLFFKDYIIVDKAFEVYHIYSYIINYKREKNNKINEKVFLKCATEYLEEDEIDYNKINFKSVENIRLLNNVLNNYYNLDDYDYNDLLEFGSFIENLSEKLYTVYKIITLKDKLDLI